MNTDVRVALAQIAVEPLDSAANLERIDDACRDAALQKADLILFPELSDLGQVPAFDRDFGVRYVEASQPVNGTFLRAVADIAADLSIHVGIGFVERDPVIPQKIYNAATLIDGAGQVLGVQRKLHPPGEERHYFARGSDVEVFKTDLGDVSIQICYDLYFPEVSRLAALRGATILCGLANIPYRDDWPHRLEHLACVRAYENMQHVALVNRLGEQHGYVYGGESVVAAPPGRVVGQAPRHEPTLLTATLSADVLTAERVRRPVFADRRPDVYGWLGDEPPIMPQPPGPGA